MKLSTLLIDLIIVSCFAILVLVYLLGYVNGQEAVYRGNTQASLHRMSVYDTVAPPAWDQGMDLSQTD